MSKSALVTGGIHRLGGKISLHLAESGYDLAIIYNNSNSDLIKSFIRNVKTYNVRTELYKCDLNDVKDIESTVKKINNDFQSIDLLINNAAIIKKLRLKELDEKVYDNIMNVNLKAVVFLTKFLIPLMLKSKDPSIINIASLGGLKNWNSFFVYSLSKTALIKATYLMAKELSPNIRVNAIAPGTINIPGEISSVEDILPVEKIPLKRLGTPDDINNTIDFLVKCNYITGQVIPVEGGRTLQ